MGLIVILLLVAAFVLALMAALGVASPRIGLHALAFALFVLALIIEHVPALGFHVH